MFKKYFQVIKNTWAEYSVYRLNFVMWRVRMFMQLLITYFLWLAIFQQRNTIFGYSQNQILTYILLVFLVSSIVLSSRTVDVGDQINRGDLSLFLLKPINYFKYWFSRDISDKILNILFSIFELTVIFLIFKPPIFIQTNPFIIATFLLSAALALLMYFFLNLLLGFIAFWTAETWAPRFMFIVLLQFLAGSMFPLDILPSPLFTILKFSPFPYFLYFPVNTYLGRFNLQILAFDFTMTIVWIFLLYFIVSFVWNLGLKNYEAAGR